MDQGLGRLLGLAVLHQLHAEHQPHPADLAPEAGRAKAPARRRPAARKTGTSEPYENSTNIGDTWTFGYTPDLVVGVWVGFDRTAQIHGASDRIASPELASATYETLSTCDKTLYIYKNGQHEHYHYRAQVPSHHGFGLIEHKAG